MPQHIRRSLLLLPLVLPLPEWALKSDADAIILDMISITPEARSQISSQLLTPVVTGATRTGAEVFIRTGRESAWADLELTVRPGLTGVVLAQVESADLVHEVSKRLLELEKRQKIPEGSLQIDVEIGTAMGVLNSLEIARSSPRLGALTVGETGLYRDLHLDAEAKLDKDPLRFIKGQIIVNARAAGLQAQGMTYPLSITMARADESELAKAVRRARDTGFKGAVCPHLSWVKVCNQGFRPSPDELAYYIKVKEVFEDGLKRGLASVPLDGRMVDVPVYKRALVFLEWGEACARRDKEKQVSMASK